MSDTRFLLSPEQDSHLAQPHSKPGAPPLELGLTAPLPQYGQGFSCARTTVLCCAISFIGHFNNVKCGPPR